MPRRPERRRPGTFPGRRFAFAAGLVAVCAAGGVGPGNAVADQTVVTAAIETGTPGGAHSASVSLSTLGGCPLYSGGSPLTLYPGSQPYLPATDSSWAVATVLTCALQIPLASVDSVQVDSPTNGFETPLSPADLDDPGEYQDPGAPGALPLISTDGGEDQNTYMRPWKGGGDRNAADEVVVTAEPISLVVNENGSPLTVHVAQRRLSHTATAARVALSATVTASGGALVPASQLAWTWNFGDGSRSTAPVPTHSFVPGSTIVTVQVTDAAIGRGGTATVEVVYDAASKQSGPSRSGAGTKRNGSTTGSRHGAGSSHGQPRSHGGSSGSGTGTQTTSSTTPTTTTPTPTPAAPSPTTTPSPGPPSPTTTPSPGPPPPTTTPNPHPRPQTAPTTPTTSVGPGQLVTGRLIGDVVAISPAVSPLTHVTPAAGAAAAVRSGRAPAPTAAIAATLAVLALLGLGARRELPGRWPPRGGWGAWLRRLHR